MDILSDLLGKKVKVAFENREAGRVKAVYGILKEFDESFIKIEYLEYPKTVILNKSDIVSISELKND